MKRAAPPQLKLALRHSFSAPRPWMPASPGGRSGGSAQRTAPFDFRFSPPPLLRGSDRSWLVHTTTYTAGTLVGVETRAGEIDRSAKISTQSGAAASGVSGQAEASAAVGDVNCRLCAHPARCSNVADCVEFSSLCRRCCLLTHG